MNKGLIHIYHGDGKGKTSCAIGLSIRSAGSGMKVLIARFLKTDDSSELNVLKKIENITVLPCTEYFGWSFQMTQEEKLQAKNILFQSPESGFKKALAEKYDMLVLVK
jgi:cob(I)alamin adenosyltransferase